MSEYQLKVYYGHIFFLPKIRSFEWDMIEVYCKDPFNSLAKSTGCKLNKFGEPEDRQMKLLNNLFVDSVCKKDLEAMAKIKKLMELRQKELKNKPMIFKGVQTLQTITYLPNKTN